MKAGTFGDHLMDTLLFGNLIGHIYLEILKNAIYPVLVENNNDHMEKLFDIPASQCATTLCTDSAAVFDAIVSITMD